MASCGAFTGTVTLLLQRAGGVGAAVAQLGSPPSRTVALFVTDRPLTAAVGVTGIVKLTGDPVARPAAMVHVTTWPVATQPAGTAPRVRPAGTVSLTVAIAVVAAVPVLVTVSV